MSSYRLRYSVLRSAAATRGDHTNYAIAKRTGLNQTTLSRVCRGLAVPAAQTLITLASTYGLSLDELVEHPLAENDDAAEVQSAASVEQSAPTCK